MIQNLVFPCVSISIFNPICIAPISWIGGCFDRIKPQALTLGNSQVLNHERYRKLLVSHIFISSIINYELKGVFYFIRYQYQHGY